MRGTPGSSPKPARPCSPSIALDDDLRTGRARRTTRDSDLFHDVSPPFALDVRAHGGVAPIGRAPGVEDAAHSGKRTFQVRGLLLQTSTDVDTRGRPRPPERNDVSDFSERQPEPPRLPDDREQRQDVSGVPTVAGGCPADRRKVASRLVEPKRLAAHAAPRRHLPDEQALWVDGRRIGPAPRGKVKWAVDAGTRARLR